MGVGGGWMGVWGSGQVPPTHAHACTHVHAHVCMYDIIGNSQGFPQRGQPFAIEIIMFNVYICVCMCMPACVCICMCVGAPSNQPTPKSTHPHPKSCREPKTLKFNKS